MGFVYIPIAQDTLVRANEFPLSDGGKWTGVTGINQLQLLNDVALQSASDSSHWNESRFTGAVFAANQFAYVTTTPSLNTGFVGPALRMNSTGNGYWFLMDAAGDIIIQRVLVGQGTGLASGTFHGSTGNALMRLEIFGTALTAKINGNIVLTATDATYATGAPGMATYEVGSTAGMVGPWVAGDIVQSSGGGSNPPRVYNTPFWVKASAVSTLRSGNGKTGTHR